MCLKVKIGMESREHEMRYSLAMKCALTFLHTWVRNMISIPFNTIAIIFVY